MEEITWDPEECIEMKDKKGRLLTMLHAPSGKVCIFAPVGSIEVDPQLQDLVHIVTFAPNTQNERVCYMVEIADNNGMNLALAMTKAVSELSEGEA